MLDSCAPGHTRTETDHHYCIRFRSKVFPTLPKARTASRIQEFSVACSRRWAAT